MNLCRSGEVKWTAYTRFSDDFRLRHAPSSTDVLDVDSGGDLTVAGDVTVATAFRYSSVQTNVLFLSGADFQNTDPSFNYYEVNLDGVVYDLDWSDTGWSGVAGVPLPQGATVIRFTAYYHVESGGGAAAAYLRRHNLMSTAGDTLAELDGTGGFNVHNGEVQTLTEMAITYPVVNNDTYRYTVSTHLDIDNFSEGVGFIGVRIEYTLLEARP